MFQNADSYLFQSRQRFCSHDDYQDELENLFNKKFQFRFNNSWELPAKDSWFSTAPWKVKQLEILKNRLNFHKSQLNDFNLEEWSSHTRRRNPAGEVGWKIRCLINPEFLTQAWTKFYECACTYSIIPREVIMDRKMVSLHLCEAPGAFITSLNHYLKSNHQGIDWKWVANTLNPYYEGNSPSNMISDDRFMFHTLNNWNFGVDNTGNLMDWQNSQAIINKAKSLGKVLLVTADGSIDCLQKPDAQEELTSPLHYCEIITALQALSTDGTLIFKLFTMFEHTTVNLLYLINHLFCEVNIYKPVTSRQGNSEVYAICLKYKGLSRLEKYLTTLQSAYGSELYGNLAMLPLDAIPESFLKQIEECALYFSSIQCQVINNNLQAYLMQNNIAFYKDVKKIRSIVATEFLWQYDLKPLEFEQEILKGILHEENKVNMNPRDHRGSYTDRQLYGKMSLGEKLNNLKSELHAELVSNPLILINEPVKWMQFYDEGTELKLVFTYGCPLKSIYSSKFIFVPIFKLYQQILAEEKFIEIIFNQAEVSVDNNKDGIEVNKRLLLPEYQHLECYHDFEKSCFKMLLKTLQQLSVGDSLLIVNFKTLTHFNVGIIYIIARKCFQEIGFTSCNSIILKNLTNKTALRYLEMVDNECDKVRTNDTKDVLNCLTVQTTNTGDFYSSIVLYNNTFYRNKCMEFILKIEQNI